MLVAKGDAIIRVMTHLRDDPACLFKMLIDVCGVDYPERGKRFDVVYNLLSLTHNQRVRVKVRVGDNQAVPSVTGVYGAANAIAGTTYGVYGTHSSPSGFAVYAAGRLKATGRTYLGAPSTAPADSDLDSGSISFYLDQTANTLKVRVKYNSITATYKTATIALV